MAGNTSAIRGSRVGSGPTGEIDNGYKAERIQKTYYCFNKHTFSPAFAASVEPDEIPTELDCPHCGLPAGLDKDNPPMVAKHEPYKTHLAYVKERRTEDEAKALLEEAVAAVRERRERLLADARAEVKKTTKSSKK
jgi:hypothetical protein